MSEMDLGSSSAVQESFRMNGYFIPYNTITGEMNFKPGNDLVAGQPDPGTFPTGISG